MENNFEQYTQKSYYFIEPHTQWVMPGQIDISTIAKRVYGKAYDSLRGYQQMDEEARNDTNYLIHIEDCYKSLLSAFDGRDELYLGYDHVKLKGVYRPDTNPLEYWLSIKIDPEEPNALYNPHPTQDLFGAVFSESFYAERAYTLPLDLVLADLIRRGELPMGDFILRHWW